MTTTTLRCAVRDKSQLSGLTVPVGGGKGKKNWEQLQQESSEGGTEPRTEGVQVGDSVQWHRHHGHFIISIQVQVMLRRGAKGGAGVRSVQVN